MNRPERILYVILLLLVTFAVALEPAWGQEVTASITGTVLDPSGAAIPNASVTATDTQRGITWPTKTNEAGVYNLPRVPIGTYALKVEAAGFQSAVRPAFTLVMNQTARIDVPLSVGTVGETVEVTGAAPVLQTDTTEVSTLINNNTVTSMPLASRNYLQLTLLAPGATNVNPDGMRQPQSMLDSGRPYINGNREQANAYLLDGQINTESKNNEVGYTPSIDAVQEFNLITQNASAEFGNYQGGVVSVGIKSGTNDFHGTLYEFLRNDLFNSNNYWAGMTAGLPSYKGLTGFDANGAAKKAQLRYNQFGGTLGGPIVKNKLFFFVDYQGQRLVTSSATGAQLLTSAARTGNFGQLCTSFGATFNAAGICQVGTTRAIQLLHPTTSLPIPFNNLAAAGLTPSPAAHNLITSQYYPEPMIDSLNGNNYFFKSGHSLNNDQGDVKIDYKISDKNSLFGRWSQMNLRQDPFTGFLFANFGDGGQLRGASTEPVRNGVLNWTHIFNTNLLNEVRIGFNAVGFNQTGTPTSSLGNIGEQFGIGGANYNAPGLLNIGIAGAGFGANASLGTINIYQIFHDTQIQLDDNLVYTRGRHNFKTGFQYVRLRQDWKYAGNNGALGALNIAGATGSGLSDFWLGSVGWSRRDTFISPSLFMDRGNIFAAYLQDNWRLTNTLTLNLGLRFEDHTPLYEANDRIVNFDLMTGEILQPGKNGASRALYNNYLGLGAFQPRVGFAWSPAFLNGKTVVRGGYAISSFYEGMGSNEALSMNPPYGIMAYGPGSTLETGYPAPTPCTGINFACYAGQRIRIMDQNFMPAITQQWNFTIQHQISDTLTFQVGYVGQHGTHLASFEDVGQSIGLNAQGKVAKPGEAIVQRIPGPYMGGGTPGSLYMAGNMNFGASSYALLGANLSNANQRYDALQAVLQKRSSRGLQGQLSYTWGKCMSDSAGYYGTGWGSTNAMSSGGQPGRQNIYDQASDWGPCYFDQTHVLSGQFTYALPLGKGKRFGSSMSPVLDTVVGGWELGSIISFHTGNALTLNVFGNWWPLEGDTSLTNGIAPFTLSARPNCDGPVRVVNRYVAPDSNTNTPGYIQWFDPSNISLPPFEGTPWAPISGTFGTCSVGNVRGPHYSNVDLSLHKNFKVTESKHLEFRMEALNAFNVKVLTFSGGPALGSFDMPNNGNFGHVTGSQGARQIQFALKFVF